ncbi:THUMP domain-containing protein [Abeliophyllum distichum]|uniref:THUMP domain-containing protein n=1 Tax=Abeliophyllum distichum TaxID=126358 RepID=A0ABD1Q131_9LAMI
MEEKCVDNAGGITRQGGAQSQRARDGSDVVGGSLSSGWVAGSGPVKKGIYALRPGVEGFFITCDGGRERQASNEAINVIDSFYEELVNGTETTTEQAELSKKPLNKITKFTFSDSSSSDGDDNDEDSKDDHHEDESNVRTKEKEENKPAIATGIDANNENLIKDELGHGKEDDISCEKQAQKNKEKTDDQEVEAVEPPAKKQCIENDALKCRNGLSNKVEKKSVDKLIEAELAELGDRSKVC